MRLILRSNSVFHRHVQAQWLFDAPERHVSVAKLSDKVKKNITQPQKRATDLLKGLWHVAAFEPCYSDGNTALKQYSL